MKFSKRIKYGITALLVLGLQSNEEFISGVEISKKGNIPAKFLEAILAKLNKSKIVETKKGAHGGHKLAKNPSEITIYEVIMILETAEFFSKSDNPIEQKGVIVDKFFDELHKKWEEDLKHSTILQLMENHKLSEEQSMYYI